MLKVLRAIFEDLSKEELLKRCLHGKTQNANESFNNILWLKCSKTVFINRQNIELGVNSASFQFNDGAHGISNVLEQFSMKYRIYTNIGSSKIDESSIQWSSTKSSKARKKKRKQLRGIKKGVIDKNNEQEKVPIFLVDFNVIYVICINYICYM